MMRIDKEFFQRPRLWRSFTLICQTKTGIRTKTDIRSEIFYDRGETPFVVKHFYRCKDLLGCEKWEPVTSLHISWSFKDTHPSWLLSNYVCDKGVVYYLIRLPHYYAEESRNSNWILGVAHLLKVIEACPAYGYMENGRAFLWEDIP